MKTPGGQRVCGDEEWGEVIVGASRDVAAQQALQLRKAGVGYAKIAEQLGSRRPAPTTW